MILDANLQVSSAQAITADAVSEHTIDLGDTTPKRQMGTGEPMGFGVFFKAEGTTTGSMVLELINSAGADLGSPVVLASLTLVTAELDPGQKVFIAMPPGKPTLRYIGLNYNITGTVDFTVDAFFMAQSSFESAPLARKGHTIS